MATEHGTPRLSAKQRRAERRAQIARRYARNQRFANKAAFHGINWDYHSHNRLYQWIHSASPATMAAKAQEWKALGTSILATTQEIRDTMRALSGSWQGAAADRAAQSSEAFGQWATRASEITQQIGAGLDQYTHAVEVAQHRMPPPLNPGAAFLSGHNTGGVTIPNSASVIAELMQDQQADDAQARDAKAEAVRVMKHYAAESENVHATMPWFYDAPAESPIGPPDSVEPTHPGPPDPVPSGPGPVDPPGIVPGTDIGTAPNSFSPAAPAPGGYGPDTGYGGQPGYGGGPGGAEAGRGGLAAGGGFGGAGPLAARGGPAGLAGGARGGAGGLAGARGAAGANGYPPFGAGGGARGEEDKEHKDKYTEGLDLFDDLPPAYPPVFGA
jgi:uncharacterized protein YukE